jgi:hypothetical protein
MIGIDFNNFENGNNTSYRPIVTKKNFPLKKIYILKKILAKICNLQSNKKNKQNHINISNQKSELENICRFAG